MRKRFDVQYELDVTPIEEVKIPVKSRDELPPVLRALQHIYITPSLNKAVFELLESKITTGRIGRPGMSLWEILVLGVVRLTLDVNYDRLEHISNYDKLVRDILGVKTFDSDGKKYPLQTIKDNVVLLDEETLNEINELVVKAGHRLKKKDKELDVKVDTYAVESNVHFPTDLNLLYDACHKCIDLVASIISDSGIYGWRKYKDWHRRIKRSFRTASRQSARGGKNFEYRLIESSETYLRIAGELSQKIKRTKDDLVTVASRSQRKALKLAQLNEFEKLLDKHINLVTRRIIYREKIPHNEKIFSLFEPYTEWINKGKSGNKVELGLNVAVCTDQYGFILYHRILEKEHDVDVAIPIAEWVLEHWGIRSISYDKGFWSKDNHAALTQIMRNLIMPKKGKLNKEEYSREHSKQFKALRNKHSAIESDINSLEHHGLNRCPDKGLEHFKRYIALGILSFNLHRLGNILIENDRKVLEKRRRRKSKAA